MDIKDQFPSVHWIWKGGISFVYEVDPRIAVKVPQSGEEEREQFSKEVEIYRIFSQNPPCPFIVQCFHISDKGIFLEYMRGTGRYFLEYRITILGTDKIWWLLEWKSWNRQNMVVTRVEKLEPLSLRKEWMNDLAQAVAFLESLNLTHGDLRPENILLDRDRLKLSDFDCTAKIGMDHEACIGPYGRFLNSNEPDEGICGSSGSLGSRTEQFALGSLYYYINYGFEVYGDRCLTEDPYEHGPKTVDLLQNMEFPELNGNPRIDDIIDKCWHNKYGKVSDLALDTNRFLNEGTEAEGSSRVGHMEEGNRKEFLLKKELCQDLEKRGLLDLLSSGEPKKIGFECQLYRYRMKA